MGDAPQKMRPDTICSSFRSGYSVNRRTTKTCTTSPGKTNDKGIRNMNAGLQQRLGTCGISLAKRGLVALLGVALFYVSANATFIYYANSTPDQPVGDNAFALTPATTANIAPRGKGGFEEKLRVSREFEQAFYRNHCLLCHNAMGDRQPGTQGESVTPPTPTTPQATGPDHFREKIAARAWASPLNGEDVTAIIDYLPSSMYGAATTDVTKGRKLYAENCSRCHGPDGRAVKTATGKRSQGGGH